MSDSQVDQADLAAIRFGALFEVGSSKSFCILKSPLSIFIIPINEVFAVYQNLFENESILRMKHTILHAWADKKHSHDAHALPGYQIYLQLRYVKLNRSLFQFKSSISS